LPTTTEFGIGAEVTISAAFDNHALAALRAHPGKWHCMPAGRAPLT
jgi:hypothetical protein